MSKITNTKEISFWNFIQTYTIEIPIIQRDYAQGRLGKENLRKNFLNDLKKALDKEHPFENTVMKLDFVYGSTENGKLHPLDGQQRLTTLWLLHWYIALRSNSLDKNVADILDKFTYKTRISSREFCHKLCQPEHFSDFKGNDIVGYITKQTWFYSAWRQDPTIQSMLRMLGGTKVIDKRGDDIDDGLEEIFKCPKLCEIKSKGKCQLIRNFKSYWDQLISDNAPIVFYHLPLQDFGLSDDLYVKMNARGKQLTSFENFKADIVGYITEQSNSELLDTETKKQWKELLDVKEDIPIKMDTTWTDVFWKNKSDNNKIDEIYFAFLNRFFFNELVCAKNIEKNRYLFAADGIEENASFNLLYGKKSDDSSIKYEDFEKYKFYNKEIPIKLFESIRNVLNKVIYDNTVINDCFPKWVDKKFSFIPTYQNNTITTLGQKERVVFLAICRYFEKGEFNKTSFSQWMRIVWNIVENAGIETVPAMIGAMRLIDDLAEGSNDIYPYLSSLINDEKRFSKDQVNEEIAKAEQILNGGSEWEFKIIKAENTAFFKGAIRFLFTNENGEIFWDDFDTKWKNAREYFTDDYKESALKDYYNNANLLKSLLSRFDNENFWSVLYWNHRTFNNKTETWRYYLLNSNIANPIHQLMMGGTNILIFEPSKEDFAQNTLYQLSNTMLLDFVMKRIPNSWIRDYHYHKAIFPSGTGVFLDASDRDDILDSFTLDVETKVPDTKFLYGSDINFKYEGHNFQWYRTDFVYLMYNNAPNKYVVKNENATEDTMKYYCRDVSNIKRVDEFKSILKDIIEESQGKDNSTSSDINIEQ